MIYQVLDDQGNVIENSIEVVKLSVLDMAYEYVELNNGKKPTQKMISDWTNQLLDSIGWNTIGELE